MEFLTVYSTYIGMNFYIYIFIIPFDIILLAYLNINKSFHLSSD